MTRIGGRFNLKPATVARPNRLGQGLWYNDPMIQKRRIVSKGTPAHWYRGADIPMRVIRRFVRQVGAQFQPDKIILFGSYAYGVPHADSDVDILVVMAARHQHTQAVRIRWAIPAPFPMNLIVRTPKNLQWRLEEGESFHTEIVTRGKVLYEKSNARLGAQG
jgi:uncharacterized protein